MTAGGQCFGPLVTGQGSCKWQGFRDPGGGGFNKLKYQ